ncbi:uncharacterized protein K441DRAFT_650944 [Cenococcum geophilum 1.58]|uniref:uncharacterized protein n=1 Tax=Cenococcum geophilum 1.58 TaxID=794803 RepID=UPI00358FA852|nr:hypothetical protein K441DRAFT_650944 [Cenococcum geophilum 1.58]
MTLTPRRAGARRGSIPLLSAGRLYSAFWLLIRDDSSQQSSRTLAAGSRLAVRKENQSAAVGAHHAGLVALSLDALQLQ